MNLIEVVCLWRRRQVTMMPIKDLWVKEEGVAGMGMGFAGAHPSASLPSLSRRVVCAHIVCVCVRARAGRVLVLGGAQPEHRLTTTRYDVSRHGLRANVIVIRTALPARGMCMCVKSTKRAPGSPAWSEHPLSA